MRFGKPLKRTFIIIAMLIIFLVSISLAVWALDQRNQSILQANAAATAKAEAIQREDESRATQAALVQTVSAAESTAEAAQATATMAEAMVRSTVQAAQATVTAAAVRETEQAKAMNCTAPMDMQAYSRQPPVAVTPLALFVYAIPFDEKGTGSFSIEGRDNRLLHYRPTGNRKQIGFVRCLFLQASIPNSPGSGSATLDFALWSPNSGSWGINEGKNQLDWGDNMVEIKFPDGLVSRQGDIYFSIRNYGTQRVEIQQVDFTLWLMSSDNTETIVKPTSE